MKDFFISYNKADKAWAEWIGWILKEAGNSVVVQAWDFRPGANFALEMDAAMEESERTIAVLSQEYLNAEYTHPEWAAAFADDPGGKKRTLVPVRVGDCKLKGLLKQIINIDFVGRSEKECAQALEDGLKSDGRPSAKPIFPGRTIKGPSPKPSFPGTATVNRGGASTDIRFSRSWPNTDPYLVGREAHIKALDEAWENDATNIVTLVAFGGIGKTALLNHWANEHMQPDAWRGAQRVYAWSFYSQGSDEGRQSSADAFVADALRWFGDEKMAASAAGAYEKGLRIAQLVQERKTLLLLDGMEPLQHPPGPHNEGVLKDPALQGLLKTLARGNPGLCVVTTRIAVKDLEAFENSSLQRIDLETLSDKDGAAYLKHLKVAGSDADLCDASKDFKGHALALTLLGHYVSAVLDGNISRRGEIPHLTADEAQGGHARAVMTGYENWFSTENKPELDILRIMGLFDRPVEHDAVDVLRAHPPIPDLTDRLDGLSEEKWKFALKHLRDAGLLAKTDANDNTLLDCHPLVREHFGEQLEKDYPEAWKEAHGRLYEHYRDKAKDFPDTVDEMQPLYAAVGHGCKAGRHQEAFDDVYWKRIQRENLFFNLKRLGAFGADMAVMSGFFDELWSRPVMDLKENARSFVLSEAGSDLRALGRLSEATEPMKAGLEADLKREDWRNAGIAAGNLSELYLTIGEMEQAVDYARQSVDLADRGGDEYQKMANRTGLADALHQMDRRNEAEGLFREAEDMQREGQPEYRFMYSLYGYRYCGLLMAQGKYDEVLERATQTLEWVTQHQLLLDIALDNLSLGHAHIMIAERDGTVDYGAGAAHLDRAVDGLRLSGQQDYLPRGLLARASFRRLRSDYDAARLDLEEAMDLATRCGMRLHETDACLEYARVYLDMADGEADKGYRELAREYVVRAEGLIEKTGYHRRDKELEELKQRLT